MMRTMQPGDNSDEAIELSQLHLAATGHPSTVDRSTVQAAPDAAPSTSESRMATSSIGTDAERHLHASELPPVDRGRHAWGFLVGAFLVEAIFLGLPSSFGVFQNYYSGQDAFKDSKSIPVIGALGLGLGYMGSPFVTQLVVFYPKSPKKLIYAGLALCVLACIGASFAKTIPQLIVTKGIMLGCGVTLAYMPTIGFINEWFVQRRGLASGIMFGGAGTSGLVLPIIFEKSLTRLGYQTTLRIWAITMAVILTPSIHFLIRGRLPDSQRTARRRLNLKFMKNPLFLLVAATNFLQGVAYFIPTIYLPSYAADLRMPAIQATLLLSFLNLSNTLGQAFIGFLSDRLGSSIPFFFSALVGGLSICVVWGLSKSFVPLVVFSFVYGLSAGGYSVLYPKFAWELAADDPHTQLLLVGFLYFERGIGSVLSGPISSALIGSQQHVQSYAINKYESIVLFTGITMCVSCISIFGKFMKRTS